MLRQLNVTVEPPTEAQAFRTLTKVGGDQVNFLEKNVYMILWYLSLKREWERDTYRELRLVELDRSGQDFENSFGARQAPLVRHSVFEVGPKIPIHQIRG